MPLSIRPTTAATARSCWRWSAMRSTQSFAAKASSAYPKIRGVSWPAASRMSWTSPDEWSRMKAGLNCVMCADIHLDENAFSHKVAEFEHTYVRLPKNQYLRGWTVVALKRHANELFELTNSELLAFWRDVARVAEAIDRLYRPA